MTLQRQLQVFFVNTFACLFVCVDVFGGHVLWFDGQQRASESERNDRENLLRTESGHQVQSRESSAQPRC